MSSDTYFDEVAGQWDQLRASFFSEAVRDQAIAAARVQKGKLAADIGAGTGFVTEGLARLGVRVIAVDQSEAMLNQMKRKFDGVEGIDIRSGGGDAIPIPDGSVDYVFTNMYLHHVEDPQQAIAEMVRILKSDGRLVITDLDEHDVEFLRTEHHDRWMGFGRRNIQTWLLNAGLEHVAISSTDESCRSTSTLGSQNAAIGMFVASGEKHGQKEATAILSSEVQSFVRHQKLGYVATVSPDGGPNLSPKGTTTVWDDQHLIFADLRSPQTVKNLRSNPRVEINVVDIFRRRGYRFKGTAEVIASGPRFAEFCTFFESLVERARERIRSVVLIKVEEVLALTSPGYDLGHTEDELVAKWRRYYAE